MPVTDTDLDRIPPPTVHTVGISEFVSLADADSIYLDKSYYLAPDDKGAKAFILLRQALEQTGRAAVAKVAIRDRESLCRGPAISGGAGAGDAVLCRRGEGYGRPEDPQEADVKPQEMKMAGSLIDNLSTTFDPSPSEDNYQEALQHLIEAKTEGRSLPKQRSPRARWST